MSAKKKSNNKGKGKSKRFALAKSILVIGLCLILLAVFTSRGGQMGMRNEELGMRNEELVSEIPDSRDPEIQKSIVPSIPDSTAKHEIPHHSSNAVIVEHTGFVLQFNTTTNNPDWVAWELTAEEVNTKAMKRSNDFKPDMLVPKGHRVETTDYKKTGFDRGHMCPAADMKWSAAAMEDCFYMSNICPQKPKLNQQWWEHLEEACRRWAKKEGSVYICCGPIYNPNTDGEHIGAGKRKVRIPEGFFKVVLSLKPGKEKAIGFMYSNSDMRQPMAEAAYSVDSVEVITGMDFFPSLDDKLENRVERMCNLTEWD